MSNYIVKIYVLHMCGFKTTFVNLKSNSAFFYNKGHNFWKSVLTPKTDLMPLLPPSFVGRASRALNLRQEQ